MRLIIEDDEGHKTVVPFQRDVLTIGRGDDNVVRLPERNVSRHHCRLIRENGTTFVEDLRSYNGVRVNGERVSGRQAVSPGDVLQIGDYDVALETDVRPEASPLDIEDTHPSIDPLPPEVIATIPGMPAVSVPSTRTPTPVNFVRQVLPVAEEDRPRVVVLAGASPGTELALEKTVASAGRAPECDLVFDDPSLARKHAQFVRDGDSWKVVEVSSIHAVKVGGRPCTEATLQDGDVIALGDVQLRWVAPGAFFHWVPPPRAAAPRRRRGAIVLLVLALAAAAGAMLAGRACAGRDGEKAAIHHRGSD